MHYGLFCRLVTGFIAAPVLALTSFNSTAQAPSESPDQSDVLIGGEVLAQNGRRFTLDYGDGVITVEMDDWDNFNEALLVTPGETVIVRGEIDRDLFELQTLEARSVAVAGRNITYYASADDEESSYTWPVESLHNDMVNEESWIGFTGMVTYMEESELTVDIGLQEVTVDTSKLTGNQSNGQADQTIAIGDTVHVTGFLDDELFHSHQVVARTVSLYE